MKTFELRKRSQEEMAFSSRESLEEAWHEWKRGDEVILTWKENDKMISEIITPSILKEISDGLIRIYSVE